jgi:hypothetical protein
MNTSDALQIVATRTAKDPTFLGYVLKLFCQHEGISEDQLAERLGIETAFLPRLYLCKRPASDASDFADRVSAIADYALIESVTLAAIIRQVDVIESLSSAPDASGLLAAARDKEEPEDKRPPKTETEKD